MRVWLWAGVLATGFVGACGDGGGSGGSSSASANGAETGDNQETVVGQGCEEGAPDVAITIDEAGFSIREVKLAPGAVLQWTNQGATEHSVISGEPNHSSAGLLFNSGTLSPGDSFCYTFSDARDVDFFCGLHPSEQGEVQVGSRDDEGDEQGDDGDDGDHSGDQDGDDHDRGGGNDDPDNPSRG